MRRQRTGLVLASCFLLIANPLFGQTTSGGGGTGGGGGGLSSGGLSSGGLSSGGLNSGGLTGGGGSGSVGISTGSTLSGGAQVTSTGGSANSIPSSSNLFGKSYANPLSLGLQSNYYPNTGNFGAPNTAAPIFGKALFAAANATTNTAAATQTTTAVGFTTVGTLRAPSYTTALNEDVPYVIHSVPQLVSTVKDVLDRSTSLSRRENIQVTVDGATVVLSGQAPSEKERRIAEGIVRMTPGVRNVVNVISVGRP